MMRILITGGDEPLGTLVAEQLHDEFELQLCGKAARLAPELSHLPYVQVDLREPEQVAPLVEGIEAILHLAPFSPAREADPTTEKHTLDYSARGTYVLLHGALKAGIKRVILVSRLDLLAAHPADARIDETWRALPETTASGLAPYLAELTLREFVRAEEMLGICLRIGELNETPDGTTPADALSALRKALVMNVSAHKHRWWLFHISSGGRFVVDAARCSPLNWERIEAVRTGASEDPNNARDN